MSTSASQGAMPLISVALCTYNGGGYLRAQIDSLLAQTYPALEIVAVDDCSTDGTWQVLQEAARQDSRIRLLRNERNLGLVANFERALGECKGDLIAPCDQDDLWEAAKLVTLARALGDAAAVYCDSSLIDEDGRPLGQKLSDRVNLYQGDDPTVFVFSNCVAGHALLFRREILRDALPFPRLRFHDWWLAFVATSRGGIRLVEQPLVQYRQHLKSRTDIARRKAPVRSVESRDRLRLYEDRAHWLKAMTRIAGPHQNYLLALYSAHLKLADAWFSAEMWSLLRQREVSLSFIDKKARRRPLGMVRKLSIGLRTKRLLGVGYPRRPLELPPP